MFKQPTVGKVSISQYDSVGNLLWFADGKNTLTYEGVDLIAGMLAWNDIKINAAYIEFVPAGFTVPSIAADPAEGISYYKALLDETSSSVDYLRVPIVTPPYTETTDSSKFTGNRVVFSAFTNGTVGLKGRPFDTGAQIFGLALVYAPVFDDRTLDIVFARSYDFTPKTKVDMTQIMLRWTHTVGEAL